MLSLGMCCYARGTKAMPRSCDTGQLLANHLVGHHLEKPMQFISKICKTVSADISSFSLERLAWDRRGIYNNVTCFGGHH